MSIMEYTWVQQPRGTVPLGMLLKMRSEGTAKVEGGRIYFYEPMLSLGAIVNAVLRNRTGELVKALTASNKLLANLIDKT